MFSDKSHNYKQIYVVSYNLPCLHIHIQYTHIVGKYVIYLCKIYTQVEKGVCGDHFWHVLQSVQINFILTDNVRMFFVSSWYVAQY
jgi:hypothetical protein